MLLRCCLSAVEVPQVPLKCRTCRLSAAGGVPRALQRQKEPNQSILPLKCRRRGSKGTPATERAESEHIAVEVPPEGLQGHSSDRKEEIKAEKMK